MCKNNVKQSVFKTEEGKQAIRNQYKQTLEHWPVSYKSRFIGETHIIESGDEKAEPLFLLHVIMNNTLAWMGDIDIWSSRFRIIAVDLPSEPGLSSDVRFSPSPNQLELWLENVIDRLGYTTIPVSIVGQSLGAFAALKFAVNKPERVKKISMLTASGIAPAKAGFIFRALPLMLLDHRGADRLNKMIACNVDIGLEATAFGTLTSKHCRSLLEPIPVFSDSELSNLTIPVQYFGGDKDVMLNTDATAERLKTYAPKLK